MLKNVQKNFDFFYYLEFFLCKFSKFFFNLKLLFNLLFFCELPTIASFELPKLTLGKDPLKLELFMVNQYVGIL